MTVGYLALLIRWSVIEIRVVLHCLIKSLYFPHLEVDVRTQTSKLVL